MEGFITNVRLVIPVNDEVSIQMSIKHIPVSHLSKQIDNHLNILAEAIQRKPRIVG